TLEAAPAGRREPITTDSASSRVARCCRLPIGRLHASPGDGPLARRMVKRIRIESQPGVPPRRFRVDRRAVVQTHDKETLRPSPVSIALVLSPSRPPQRLIPSTTLVANV